MPYSGIDYNSTYKTVDSISGPLNLCLNLFFQKPTRNCVYITYLFFFSTWTVYEQDRKRGLYVQLYRLWYKNSAYIVSKHHNTHKKSYYFHISILKKKLKVKSPCLPEANNIWKATYDKNTWVIPFCICSSIIEKV